MEFQVETSERDHRSGTVMAQRLSSPIRQQAINEGTCWRTAVDRWKDETAVRINESDWDPAPDDELRVQIAGGSAKDMSSVITQGRGLPIYRPVGSEAPLFNYRDPAARSASLALDRVYQNSRGCIDQNSVRYKMDKFAAGLPQVFTRSSGGRGRNGRRVRVPSAFIESLYWSSLPEAGERHGAQGYTPTTAGAGTITGGHSLGDLSAADGGGGLGDLESHGYGTATGGGQADLEAGGDGGAAPAQQPLLLVNPPVSAERCNSEESAGYYGRPELTSRHGVINQGYTAGAGTSTGYHSLNLQAADGGGGSGDLESHGSNPTRPTSGILLPQIRRSMATRISRLGHYFLMNTTATGGGQADLEAGGEQAGGGATPAQQPSVNEEEEANTLGHFFLQTYATLLPASAMAYPVLKDAPKHVKIIIFGGLVVIISIVLFAGILSRSLARRRLAFWLVSCSAVALLTFSFASQLF